MSDVNTLTQFSIPVKYNSDDIDFVVMARLVGRLSLSIVRIGNRSVAVLTVEDKLPVAMEVDDGR